MAPANFRTYEGQLRLLTAVIAAHPDLRLNYKDLAKHYGSDWTESGVEHFFRPIKKNGTAIRAMVKPIHKFFGESTPDGIQFQFRAIKQNADKMRQGKGAAAPSPATPGGAGNTPKTPRTTGTGGSRKRAAPSTGKTPATKKAKSTANVEEIDDDSDDDLPPMKPVAFKSNVNDEAMRAHEAKMGFSYPPETAPSLASAQAASPEEDDEDLKVIAPADAAPSFSNSQQSYAPAYSFNQSTGPAGGASCRYEASPFFDNASYHHGKEAAYVVGDDGDDDDYAV